MFFAKKVFYSSWSRWFLKEQKIYILPYNCLYHFYHHWIYQILTRWVTNKMFFFKTNIYIGKSRIDSGEFLIFSLEIELCPTAFPCFRPLTAFKHSVLEKSFIFFLLRLFLISTFSADLVYRSWNFCPVLLVRPASIICEISSISFAKYSKALRNIFPLLSSHY